jgi:pimeloyl-ACP methyl ester carboxylesterase
VLSISPRQSFELPRRRSLAWRSGVLAAVLVGLWSGSIACLWTSENTLVYQARRSRLRSLVATEGVFQLTTADGVRLDAVRLAHAGDSPYWILYCPPSAATIHGMRVRPHLKALHAAGYNVFSFDYRGFGRNEGEPSEWGLYEDALTAYRHLTGELGVAPSRVVIAGRSLGSAVAIDLSTRVPSAGLLLLSAIESVPATASRFYPWAPVHLLASQRFDSTAKASRVRVPVLQVHAPEDFLIPIEAARALFNRFPGRKVMLEVAGGHNDVGFRDDALTQALVELWPVPAPPPQDPCARASVWLAGSRVTPCEAQRRDQPTPARR